MHKDVGNVGDGRPDSENQGRNTKGTATAGDEARSRSRTSGGENGSARADRFRADRVTSYFRKEWAVLLAVAISGMIYNLGLLAGPWFEGQLAGCLVEVLQGQSTFQAMLWLAAAYVVVIAIVQIARYIKRFYVRRFANNVNRRMKRILYGSLVRRGRAELQEEGAGNVLTKAILDVDDCAEGMRKFTTEIFDTGVALAAYAGMLLWYDWRLAIVSMLFPPIAYWLAEHMKVRVQQTGAAYKEQSGRLSAATLDRAANAMTYRAFGMEADRNAAYEEHLTAYEHAAVRANIWGGVMPPLYQDISMIGALFILYYGCRNVLGQGWTSWDVAALATYLACYGKLAKKSSSAAKLFNAVHKAQVSWRRIKPFMENAREQENVEIAAPAVLEARHVTFTYPSGSRILQDVSFMARPGEVIGVTGAVACGKSTLGRLFLGEYPYEGSVLYGGKELTEQAMTGIVGYLGHDAELFNDTIENNVLLGDAGDAMEYLRAVCMEQEVLEMPDGLQTVVGSSGVRLSGGQAKRLALARTLAHKRPVLILDDPFAALDQPTEAQVYENLRAMAGDSIIVLISHRLYLFPQMSQVLWMEHGRVTAGSHERLMEQVPEYAGLYLEQMEGGTADPASVRQDGQA